MSARRWKQPAEVAQRRVKQARDEILDKMAKGDTVTKEERDALKAKSQ